MIKNQNNEMEFDECRKCTKNESNLKREVN